MRSSFGKVFMGAAGGDVPSEDQFNRVSFLSHFEGANNGVNNAFDDGSDSNHTITANGNATQGSFGPFARPDGEWAVSYNQNGNDYFAVPDSTDFNIASGADWTLEFWGFYTNVAANNQIVDTRPNDVNGFYFTAAVNTNKKVYFYTNGDYRLTTAASINLNEWVHIAFVRSSGTLKIYINGTADSNTYSDSNTYISGNWWIGTRQITAGNWTYGSMSNFRFVNGTAVYTSNFTPSTSKLTAITNTKLLTFQSNRFVDNSASAHTITPAGAPAVTAFGPFLTSAVYSAGRNGASAYFDGSGDYVHTPESAYSNTGSFTVEAWVYTTVTDTSTERRQHIIAQQKDNDASRSNFNLHIVYATQIVFVVFSASGDKSADVSSNTGLSPNTWTHIAGSFDGSNLRLFVNGVLKDTTASTNAPRNTTQPVAVGARTTNNGGTSGTEFFQGYLSDARLTKSAVYTSAFTPPTAPLTAITNTSLLLNMADGQAIDSTAQNNFELIGNANVSTDQAKFGDTSLHLDGTGDFAALGGSHVFGTGDYTIEMFVYHTSVSGQQTYFSDANGNQAGVYFYKDSNNKLGLYYTGQIVTGSGNVPANQWVHVSVCRASGTSRLFLNGVLQGSASDTVNLTQTAYAIGDSADSTSGEFIGYIDEVRVSKMARYTSNFTVPSEPFADKGQ